jgi:ATP-dependent DNA helicase RecQ
MKHPEMGNPREILREVFGFGGFRDRQGEIIGRVIEGKDAFVVMPTGGGKSLCYQIPALVRPGTGIVISPLISLMADQVRQLKKLGIRADFLNSSQNLSTQKDVRDELESGNLDLLYVAPERLGAQSFAEALARLIHEFSDSSEFFVNWKQFDGLAAFVR